MVSDLQDDLSLLSSGTFTLTGLQTANIRLADYADVLETGSSSLAQSKKLLKDLQGMIQKAKKEILGTEDSEQLQNMLSILKKLVPIFPRLWN